MLFNGRAYSVLIASSSDKFASVLSSLLPEYYCVPIKNVNNIAAAKREVLERHFDIIIINSPLTDDDGITFAIDISSRGNSICLLILKTDFYEEAFWKLLDCGVFTVAKPISSIVLRTAIRNLMTAHERLRISEAKTVSIEERMNDIKMVNRAKWLLIANLKMTEDDAHHYIERQAMNTCSSKRDVAAQIIKTYT